MGLLDQVTSMLGGSQAEQGEQGLSKATLLPALIDYVSNHEGGLGGLVQKFHENGLSDIVNSWIGSGANQAVSPEQLGNALGQSDVQQIAQKVGVDPSALLGQLSSILPGLVDKVTPNGELPADGKLGGVASLIGSLTSFLK